MGNNELVLPTPNRRRFKGWTACTVAVVSFASGSLLTGRLPRPNQVRADSNRVFELLVYHAIPGKGPALESIFRGVAKLQAKHDLNVIGYWVPNEDPAWQDTFIYLVAHPSRNEAEKNWQALNADPEFAAYREAVKPLLQKTDDQYKVDEVYMRQADFSAMR